MYKPERVNENLIILHNDKGDHIELFIDAVKNLQVCNGIRDDYVFTQAEAYAVLEYLMYFAAHGCLPPIDNQPPPEL